MVLTRRPRRFQKKRVVRRRTRRFARKSSGFRVPGTMVSTGRSIISNRYKTKLIWADFYTTVTAGGGVIAWKQYNANGLFAPETSNSHQPRGFDQLMTLYQSYTVNAVKVIVEGRFYSSNLDISPVTGNVILGTRNPSAGGLPVDMIDACENRQFITVTRGDQTAFKISKYYSIPKILGIPANRLVSDIQYSGNAIPPSTGANPSYIPTIDLGFVAVDSATSIGVRYTVTLVFYADLFNPVQMGKS